MNVFSGYEDGLVREVIQLYASQGFSLSILDGYFYWSDWQQKRIGMLLGVSGI